MTPFTLVALQRNLIKLVLKSFLPRACPISFEKLDWPWLLTWYERNPIECQPGSYRNEIVTHATASPFGPDILGN